MDPVLTTVRPSTRLEPNGLRLSTEQEGCTDGQPPTIDPPQSVSTVPYSTSQVKTTDWQNLYSAIPDRNLSPCGTGCRLLLQHNLHPRLPLAMFRVRGFGNPRMWVAGWSGFPDLQIVCRGWTCFLSCLGVGYGWVDVK